MTAQRPMPPVVVIDSIMGAGKTTYIIEHMNKAHNDALARFLDNASTPMPKFLYLTLLLDEVDRIKAACPALDFRDPVPVHGRKYQDLDRLIDEGANIATTHALFTMITQETLRKLKVRGYTLVIDEVLTCVDHFSALTRPDLLMLFEQKLVYVDAADHLRWNHNKWPNYTGKFETVRNLCDNGNLIAWSMEGKFVPGKRGSILLWAFPTEFLSVFENVYILTYLFHGSPMRAYLDAEGIRFDTRTVTDKGKRLVPWSPDAEKDAKARIRRDLKVYEGELNAPGKKKDGVKTKPLGKNWFGNAETVTLEALRTATVNYFRQFSRDNGKRVASRFFAWTTFKAHRKSLAGKGYKHYTCWIPLNAKATNEYRHKTVLAYLANRYSIPDIAGYFESRGVKVYNDLYATSEMIQWIWRSAIRDEQNPQEVNVFIPSDRMRSLLKLWLSCDDALSFIKKVTGGELVITPEGPEMELAVPRPIRYFADAAD